MRQDRLDRELAATEEVIGKLNQRNEQDLNDLPGNYKHDIATDLKNIIMILSHRVKELRESI